MAPPTQGLPSPRAPGQPAQRLQPAPQVDVDVVKPGDHQQRFYGAVRPAEHHQDEAGLGRQNPSLRPGPAGLGGGEPATHRRSPLGLGSPHRGVPARQPQRPAPDCGGLPIQDRTGPGR